MSATSSTSWLVVLATVFMSLNILWVLFLMIDANRRPNLPSFLSYCGLICHVIPSAFLLGTTIIAGRHHDPALICFEALLAFRYWRTLINLLFWFRYQPAVEIGAPKTTASDCSVIVPTVGPSDNQVYDEVVTAILFNRPARLIFSTNTQDAADEVMAALPAIQADIAAGETAYQKQYGLGPFTVTTKIVVLSANISNKREQVVHAFDAVETKILVMVDDTAIWNSNFLDATLPAFGSEKVGFVDCRKWVKRLPHPRDPSLNFVAGLWDQYQRGFWNCMGGLYLVRHNFEIKATNTADGGVFCVSGRSSLIRTSIVKNAHFAHEFTHEFLTIPGIGGFGPAKADDDNFITRWLINNKYDVKIQYSKEATMTTILGKYPLKFPDQCKRWSRTTFRQNPIALFYDRTIWYKWPLSVWTTYIPWLHNAALIWDGLAVFTLTQTNLYANSLHRTQMLCGLSFFIWMTKLVKTIPWFYKYPMDFLLYFVIPAYPLAVYCHSTLKLWTAVTFWDLEWSGRKNLPSARVVATVVLNLIMASVRVLMHICIGLLGVA